MSRRLDQAIELLEQELASFSPERADGARARELVERYARVERLGASGKLLALRRVASTRAWSKAGPFRNINEWFASITKSTAGEAKATTKTAQRLEALPETEAAARAGELSSTQLDTITDAATADPNAERSLLKTAKRDGVRGLRRHAARVKAAACTDEAAREERIRADRSLRNWTDPDGAGHIHVRGPVVDVARVMAALEPFEKQIFDCARNAALRERAEAYAFDALVAMADASRDGQGGGSKHASARYVGVIRIDHRALVRGHTESGEISELAGVGPIPVHEASRLLDDAFLKAVVVNGTDITVVSHLGRLIPAQLRTAVEEMYQECCIEGCNQQRHLEIDHNTPIEHGGPTALWNLSRVCTYHHRYKHKHNLRLAGEGTHKYFVPDPPGNERRARAPADRGMKEPSLV